MQRDAAGVTTADAADPSPAHGNRQARAETTADLLPQQVHLRLLQLVHVKVFVRDFVVRVLTVDRGAVRLTWVGFSLEGIGYLWLEMETSIVLKLMIA